MNWEDGNYVYILKCKDNTLYTGSAKNPLKRLEQHRLGKGAKYTRPRLPLEIVYVEPCPDWSTALRRENEIKKLTRHQKIRLIESTMNRQPSHFIVK